MAYLVTNDPIDIKRVSDDRVDAENVFPRLKEAMRYARELASDVKRQILERLQEREIELLHDAKAEAAAPTPDMSEPGVDGNGSPTDEVA